MLRIITKQRDHTYHLELHGRVADDWIAVLEGHWRAILDRVPTAIVTVSVSNVDFIDPDGERLLRRMAECGVKFDGNGCLNRYVIERIATGMG
ncbi:MAG: hypothetical protein WC815_02950 [Vicinamibacterales bacterium]|jgi:hypothetical protein